MVNYQTTPLTLGQMLVDSVTGVPVGLRNPNSQLSDMVQNVAGYLPTMQYNAISTASGVFAANVAIGSAETYLLSSGATALTTPTAAAMLATLPTGIPARGVGLIYVLRFINTNGGTLTITPDASVTLTGTATIATNTWREFMVTYTSATACTWQVIGTGTHS